MPSTFKILNLLNSKYFHVWKYANNIDRISALKHTLRSNITILENDPNTFECLLQEQNKEKFIDKVEELLYMNKSSWIYNGYINYYDLVKSIRIIKDQLSHNKKDDFQIYLSSLWYKKEFDLTSELTFKMLKRLKESYISKSTETFAILNDNTASILQIDQDITNWNIPLSMFELIEYTEDNKILSGPFHY